MNKTALFAQYLNWLPTCGKLTEPRTLYFITNYTTVSCPIINSDSGLRFRLLVNHKTVLTCCDTRGIAVRNRDAILDNTECTWLTEIKSYNHLNLL